MDDCIFCKRAKGDPAFDTTKVVFEDENTKAFYDLHPKAPVHIILIPKAHIQSIAHLEVDHNDMVFRLLYTAKEVAKTLGLKGYKLVFNVGKEGGQTIDHLHLHMLGGWGEADEKKVEV